VSEWGGGTALGTPQLRIKKTFKHPPLDTAEARALTLEQFRSQIERCKLLERMQTTRDIINQEAGRMILYQDLYIPSENVMCKYTFEEPKVNYQMALTLRENGPTLVFSLHKPNHTAGWGVIREGYHYVVQPSRWEIKLELRVYPEIVNNLDLRGWFTYLLSGFRNRRKPLVKNCLVPAPFESSATSGH
jgi:hypothetical protein